MKTERDDLPGIEIQLMDTAIEPQVTVAPEGEVRFVAINHGQQPRDLAIVRTDSEVEALRVENGELREGTGEVVATIAGIAAGDSGEAAVRMNEGRYVLVASGPDAARMGTEFTVQPQEGLEDKPSIPATSG